MLVNTPPVLALKVVRQNRIELTAELFAATVPSNVAVFLPDAVIASVTAVGAAAGAELAATKLLLKPYEVPEVVTATIWK